MKPQTLRNWVVVAGLCIAAPLQSVVAAGNADDGKTKFYACGGCHAVPGYANAFPTYPVPRIGGQHPDAILAALDAYKSGARKHGSMEGNSSGLSKQDAEDIAAYQRSGSSGGAVAGSPTVGKSKAESCGACHGADGVSPAGNVPILAGQLDGYLVKALKDYRTGKRNNPVMGGMAAALSEQDMTDIAAYYASQAKGVVTVKD